MTPRILPTWLQFRRTRILGARVYVHWSVLVAFLGYVNVVIALANLAPAPGFDGHIAWRAVPLLWKRRSATGPRRRR
jgi:Zn-dependent protease